MASFISSSKERSIWVFFLVAVMVIGGSYLNNQTPDPEHLAFKQRELFWQHKVHALLPHSYNVIASGDSRVYRGFSPEMVEQTLPELSVLNYGFSGGGHNAFIFRQLDDLLVLSGPRIIILGISPYSLTPKAQANGTYDDYFRKGPERWDDNINEFFRAISLSHVKKTIKGEPPKPLDYSYQYLNNGYVRSDWTHREPTSELKVFETDFDGNKVDPKIINDIMEQTRKWTAQGIMVIAYRPPTTPEMEAIEGAHSGFNGPSFAAAFRSAGGIWVNTDDGYVSYDGSHLTPESTDKLSKILAQTIARASKSP